MLTAESVLRVAAMALGLRVIGSPGAPIGSIVISLVMIYITHLVLGGSLPAGATRRLGWKAVLGPMLVIVVGGIGAATPISSSWSAVGACVAGLGFGGAALLWYARPVVPRGESVLRWSQR